MTDIKLIPREMWLPVTAVGGIVLAIFSASIYIANLSSQVQANKEDITAHMTMDDARVETMRIQINSTQSEQAKMNVKLDYIVTTLDEIKKGIK